MLGFPATIVPSEARGNGIETVGASPSETTIYHSVKFQDQLEALDGILGSCDFSIQPRDDLTVDCRGSFIYKPLLVQLRLNQLRTKYLRYLTAVSHPLGPSPAPVASAP